MTLGRRRTPTSTPLSFEIGHPTKAPRSLKRRSPSQGTSHELSARHVCTRLSAQISMPHCGVSCRRLRATAQHHRTSADRRSPARPMMRPACGSVYMNRQGSEVAMNASDRSFHSFARRELHQQSGVQERFGLRARFPSILRADRSPFPRRSGPLSRWLQRFESRSGRHKLSAFAAQMWLFVFFVTTSLCAAMIDALALCVAHVVVHSTCSSIVVASRRSLHFAKLPSPSWSPTPYRPRRASCSGTFLLSPSTPSPSGPPRRSRLSMPPPPPAAVDFPHGVLHVCLHGSSSSCRCAPAELHLGVIAALVEVVDARAVHSHRRSRPRCWPTA